MRRYFTDADIQAYNNNNGNVRKGDEFVDFFGSFSNCQQHLTKLGMEARQGLEQRSMGALRRTLHLTEFYATFISSRHAHTFYVALEDSP